MSTNYNELKSIKTYFKTCICIPSVVSNLKQNEALLVVPSVAFVIGCIRAYIFIRVH